MGDSNVLSEFSTVIDKRLHPVTKYIYELSKELNIEDTNGVLGNELELIALVRNCEFLYDKQKPDFKDITKKNLAWEAIANVMRSTANEVQLRWRNLREAYNKYKKDLEASKEIGIIKEWEFYEDMKFIEPHIIHRRMKISSNFTNSDSDEFKEETQSLPISENGLNDQPLDILQLIAIIESKPILYNSKHPEYRNKSMKLLVWNEIAQIVGISAQECELKWKALRERYGRERKMQNLGGERRHWEYFNSLIFLDSHVKPRRHSLFRTSVSKVSPDSSNKINMVNVSVSSNTITQDATLLMGSELLKTISIPTVHDVEEIQHVEFVDTSNPVSSKTPSPTLENKLSIKSVHLSNSQSSSQIIYDEDDLFGQTIAAELKRMPSGKKKMKIKADMYKLLYENESD